jgi:hypothetical protein
MNITPTINPADLALWKNILCKVSREFHYFLPQKSAQSLADLPRFSEGWE